MKDRIHSRAHLKAVHDAQMQSLREQYPEFQGLHTLFKVTAMRSESVYEG